MPTIADLLFSVRQLSLPSNGTPTKRQIEAVEHLGFGPPPASMTFAEASALLTARGAARDVLQELISKGRNRRERRLQLEPYLIQFITSDASIMRELIQRNEHRWGFCKDDVPPPTPVTKTKVFSEARRLIAERLIAEMPRTTDNVIPLPRRNYSPVRKKTTAAPKARGRRTRRSYSRNYFWWWKRKSATAIGVQIVLLILLFAGIKTWKYGWSSDTVFVGGRSFKAPTIKKSVSSGNLIGRASVIDGDTIEIHG